MKKVKEKLNDDKKTSKPTWYLIIDLCINALVPIILLICVICLVKYIQNNGL